MSGAHFGQRLAAAEQIDGLRRRSVHRVEHLQRLHAVVVVGSGFEEQLLDRAGLRIAPGLGEANRRRLIVNDVDRVLRRCLNLLAVRPGQLDPVQALALDLEHAGQGAVALHGQRRSRAVVQQNPASRRRHRRRDAELHVGAADGGDIAAAFHLARREPGVRRKVVFEIQLRHGGQIDNRQREHRRAHAVRLDVVVDRLLEVKQHAFKRAVRRGVCAGRRDERHPFERRARRRTHHHAGILRGEPDQLRPNRLIAAARHLDTAWRHVDPVRTGGFRAARDDQERRQPVPQVAGTQGHDHRRDRGDGGEGERVPPDRCVVGGVAAFNRYAAIDGLLDEAVDQLGRVIGRSAVGCRFNGADDGRLERRIALLQIHRHLRIGDAAAQRPYQSIRQQPHEDGDGDDAKRDNGGGAEPEGLEARRREQQRQNGPRHHDDGAAHGQPETPAVAHAANHVNESGSMVHIEFQSSFRIPD